MYFRYGLSTLGAEVIGVKIEFNLASDPISGTRNTIVNVMLK